MTEFYYDTVNFDPGRPPKLAIEFAGVDHILAGSDYPHQIGSIPLMLGTPLEVSDAAASCVEKTDERHQPELLGHHVDVPGCSGWMSHGSAEHPVNVDMMQEFWLMPLVGFLYDTTLAAASLTFNGVPERFPRIKWALCHLGGTIPYLVERLDRGFHNFKDCRAKIQRPPSTYLKEFYYDTVNFNQGALKLAIEFAGADHILAGSDYPHQIGSIPLMLEAVDALPVSDEQREGIRWKNAARLLGLEERVGR